MVALSVSISASRSPSPSFSPTFFSQRCTVPMVMVGDRAGRLICGTHQHECQGTSGGDACAACTTFMCDGYELPGAAGGAEAAGGGGGAEAAGEELTPAALMESSVTS